MAETKSASGRPKITIHYRPAELASGQEPATEYGHCHTHGLEQAYQHPELILRCFSASKSQALVDAIVERILSKGQRLEEGVSYDGFLSIPIAFQAVEVEGKKCLEMVMYSEGNEEWVEADVVGQEIGKIDGLDDLVQLGDEGATAGVVVSHWGCGGVRR